MANIRVRVLAVAYLSSGEGSRAGEETIGNCIVQGPLKMWHAGVLD